MGEKHMSVFRYSFVTAVVLMIFFGFVQESRSETAYISDSFKITFRTGPAPTHRIITMLESGQPVEVLEAQDDWSRVRVGGSGADAREGWVLSRYLITRRPWRMQAQALRAENERFKERVVVLQEKLRDTEKMQEELTAKLNETTRDLDQLQADYKALEQGSAEFLELQRNFEATQAKLKLAREEFAALNEQYKQLRYSERNTWFAIGAGILLFGLVFGMILGRREKKRRARLY
jgi:SH3 domain protein